MMRLTPLLLAALLTTGANGAPTFDVSSGTTIRAFASARSPTRWDPCPPTGATRAPWLSISNWARTNCRLPGADENPFWHTARTSGRR